METKVGDRTDEFTRDITATKSRRNKSNEWKSPIRREKGRKGGREGGKETYIAVLILVILLHGREVGDDPVQRHEDRDGPREFIQKGKRA